MPDLYADGEKGRRLQGSQDPSEDAAATKLWAFYVSEAEKYDKALVESWKSDMEGILIFAGLFSASLTAFIIESYPTLVPDSGDTTVQLLSQISQQLAAAANGSSFHMPTPAPPFAPPTTSLVCNSLWFVSLGLSLSCALVATLVEQWARDFLHKADLRSAPAMRARIFSYLYYGLKRFSMHAVVDIIPLLLHASLLLFFAGLVAFLMPISTPMAAVAGAILVIVSGVYSVLTLLPLIYLDCPYRTPLSGAFWELSRQIRRWFQRRYLASLETTADKTAMGAMSHQATHPSPERTVRDYQALVWTVKSLADDTELEPFAEAIPDVVCGSQSVRSAYRDHIRNLIQNADLELLSRLRGLLLSCYSGLLSDAVVRRRQTTYYRALWAIASLPPSPSVHMLLEFPEFQHYSSSATQWAYYVHSITLLVQWSAFLSAKAQVPNLLRDIARFRIDINNGRIPELQPLVSLVKSWWNTNLPILEDQLLTRKLNRPLRRILEGLARILEDLVINVPHRLLFRFLRHAALLKSPPFRYLDTRSVITLHPSAPFSAWKDQLDMALKAVVYTTAADSEDWVDEVVRELCSYWTPDQALEPTPIPLAIIQYVNTCKSEISYGHTCGKHTP